MRTAIAEEVVAWDDGEALVPLSALVLDTGSICCICTLLLSICTSCCCALFALLDCSSLEYFARVLNFAGIALFWWSVSISLLFLLIAFFTYHTIGHLAPAIAVFVVLRIGENLIFNIFACQIFGEVMHLEILHIPMWFRILVCLQYPPAARVLLRGNLEAKHGAAARARAALLLHRAGFEPPPPWPPSAGRAVV